MHIILTHEQADFDALGALLGASLVHEHAIPVLPRRMNRNVRSFLTIYGEELPFTDPRDLSGDPIEQITLVDTQSMITLKGMSSETRVHVVDHHQQRPDLIADWDVRLEITGSTTALFVEEIQEQHISLSLVHSTLMLLGIYEDTGSLTYASTTARDIRAAAYLVEQGASLKIASTFLNPPLSEDQRQVYERLLASLQFYNIRKRNIAIAITDASELEEEISSIAHKLRDLVEPDALFLLVGTGDGIRLVARGTTDAVNVANVAAHFGGGGHDRAAAALIKRDENSPKMENHLTAIQQELVQILPEFIHPSITVGQIMSPKPQLLKPETTASDAVQMMQRYGYEGFPVVMDGKVIGLLTRRAVDRAIHHRMNLTAASLMEAGDFHVKPDASIDELQQVMMDSGWGQIPVVNPETNQIIGIVTRTDVLKTLTLQDRQASYKNMAERLEKALPAARLNLLRIVAEVAHQQRCPAYIVGGFVRDLLLERPSLDFDVVVEGDAIALGKALVRLYEGRVLFHERFGTAKWYIDYHNAKLIEKVGSSENGYRKDLPEFLDLISARREFYEHPTALPTVERGSIKLDLHRRDFTINTLALRLDGRHYGELHDYWGGLTDLRRGLVRVLHSLSFIDDPTRLLRAVRFEIRFGFQIEKRTQQLIGEACPLLRQVSGDRLRHEFDLILAEPRAPQMMARLAELHILQSIHPMLPTEVPINGAATYFDLIHSIPGDGWEIADRIGSVPRPRLLAYLIWLGKVGGKDLRAICERLKLSAMMSRALFAVHDLLADLPNLRHVKPSVVVNRLEDVPAVAIYTVYLLAEDNESRKMLETYQHTWKKVAPCTTGNDLAERGLPPGPRYNLILKVLRDAWLDGSINTSAAEQALLEQYLNQ